MASLFDYLMRMQPRFGQEGLPTYYGQPGAGGPQEAYGGYWDPSMEGEPEPESSGQLYSGLAYGPGLTSPYGALDTPGVAQMAQMAQVNQQPMQGMWQGVAPRSFERQDLGPEFGFSPYSQVQTGPPRGAQQPPEQQPRRPSAFSPGQQGRRF
jgi:hypothetical protein